MNKKAWSLLLGFLILSSISSAWYSDLYENRRLINLTTGQPIEFLSNRTPYFEINTVSLIGNGSMRADCSDSLIVDGADITELCFEIEACNTTYTRFWSKVPILYNATTINSIYLYYGYPSGTDSQNATCAFSEWDSVYHLEANGTDATGFFNLTEVTNSPVHIAEATHCQYPPCLNSTGGSYFSNITSAHPYYTPGSIQVLVWSSKSSTFTDYQSIISVVKHDDSNANYDWWVAWGGGTAQSTWYVPGGSLDKHFHQSVETISFYVMNATGGSPLTTVYINGSFESSFDTDRVSYDGSAERMCIGGNTNPLRGTIDEIRIVGVIKANLTDDEIAFEQTKNYTVGPEESLEGLTVTLASPTHLDTFYNKSVTFNYSITTKNVTTCNLNLDGDIIFNNTDDNNSMFINPHNSTYGGHSWYVYCNSSTDNVTSATWSYTVTYNVSSVAPEDNVQLSGNSTSFNYSTENLYPIICNLTLDGTVINTQTVNYTDIINYVGSPIETGSYDWYVSCYGADRPSYNITSSTRSFIMNMPNYTYILNLSTLPENVINYPQNLFYDVDGTLHALYFVDETPTDTLVIKRIINNTVNATFTATLNATSQFFVVFRENDFTEILTFSQDGTLQHTLNLTDSSLTVVTSASIYNATNNAQFDAYGYAYTKQYETITYGANSFYIFFLPEANGTKILKKEIGAINFSTIETINDNSNITWATVANNTLLDIWYYISPTDNGTTNFLTLRAYNGTAVINLTNINVSNTYTATKLADITIFYEQSGSYTYALIINATDDATEIEDSIYMIEKNVSFKFEETIINPSHFLFIEEDTFVFFFESGEDTYAYSCYYNTTALTCLKFPSSQYGVVVPYDRGPFTTAKRENNEDEITRGALISNVVTQLHYNRNIYDTKFRTFDEQTEERAMFTINLFSDENALVLSNNSWGWVIPSTLIGNGTQKTYTLGVDGTLRLFIVGLTEGYNLDLYTLNNTQGSYYTFTVENRFGLPLEGVRISAYRFMPSKASWAIIEQGITDSNGNAILFLEPIILHQLVIENSGYVTQNLEIIPTATTSITFVLDQEGAESLLLPEFDYMFQDVSFSLTPQSIFFRNDTNLSFQVSSNGSKLEYYGMQVYQLINSTASEVYNQNITAGPSGGILQYPATEPGRYLVTYWFKHQDHDEYNSLPRTFTYNNASYGFAQSRDYFALNSPISGWTLYFIGLILAMLTVGFVSRYTVDGAGLAGLTVLWGFTIFAPDAVIAGGITTTMASIVATLATVAGLYIRNYI